MNKLIKAALIPLAIAVVGSGAMLVSNMSKEEPAQTVQSAVTFEGEAKETPVEVVVEETKPTEAYVPPVAPAKAVEEKPLSLLDYAKTQLNLSTPQLEACFNMIVQEYPDRFVGAEAHNNVKALKVYVDVCGSGIMTRPGVSSGSLFLWDRRYKGAFFDSDLAKSQH